MLGRRYFHTISLQLQMIAGYTLINLSQCVTQQISQISCSEKMADPLDEVHSPSYNYSLLLMSTSFTLPLPLLPKSDFR